MATWPLKRRLSFAVAVLGRRVAEVPLPLFKLGITAVLESEMSEAGVALFLVLDLRSYEVV